MLKNNKLLSILALIIAGEAIFLLPFILIRVFKPIIREALLISDAQIGEAQALYGTTAVISYFLGGFIADKWKAKNLLIVSLLFTALGGVYLLFSPTITGLKLLYSFWGVSTILLFWASLIKATRQWGNENNQGLSFGLLDGGRGFFAASIALFGASILSFFFPENGTITLHEKTITLKYIIGAITVIVIIVAFLLWFLLPENNTKTTKNEFKFDLKKSLKLLIEPKVLFHSVIIFCAYCAYKLTGIYGTYAKDVWNYSIEESTYFAVFIQYLRPLAAILIGWFADRFVPSKIMIPCFSFLIISSLILGLGITNNSTVILSTTTFILMAFGTYALRGLYFAIIEETKLPMQLTGTLVGIISVIGFTPDIFMSLFIGYTLGENPTITEYENLFTYFSIIPVFGLISTLFFRKFNA